MTTLLEALEALDPATRERVVQTIRAGEAMTAMLQDSEASRVVNDAADKLAKRRNPAHQTTDDVAQIYVDRVLAKVDEKLAERDKKSSQQQAEDQLAVKIASLKSKDGFTDEGIAGVLKLMQDKGVADFDIAAREYMREHPVATPTTRMSERMYWNVDGVMNSGNEKDFFFPKDGRKTITDDPDAWERDTALMALNGEIDYPA